MSRMIDADALKEKAWDADTRCGYVQVVDVGDIDDAPTIVPSAQPQPQWIPVSERLPKENDSFYVLCCDDHGEEMIGHVFKSDDSSTGHSAESEECYMYNVVAWMPLPEPMTK